VWLVRNECWWFRQYPAKEVQNHSPYRKTDNGNQVYEVYLAMAAIPAFCPFVVVAFGLWYGRNLDFGGILQIMASSGGYL
jgi:hypothetical protein